MATFTFRLLLALSLALLWMRWAAGRRGFTDDEAWSLGIWVAVGALLGGRVAYLLLHADYFRHYPLAAFQLRFVPGLGGEGAWMGALLAAWLWGRKAERSLRSVLTFLAPALLLVAAGGWWACADVGCAWGRESLHGPVWLRFLSHEAPDLYHTVVPRYAVQWLKAGGLLFLAIVAMRARFALVAMSAAFLWSAGLTFLQGDPQLHCLGVRMDSALDILLAGILLLVQSPPKPIIPIA